MVEWEKKSLIARSGYTGEDGFEIYCDQNDLWEWIELFSSKIDQQEIRLIGLAARDSLRLEAGFPLYGHELSDEISPLQAGLRWAVCFEKENFVGSNALQRSKVMDCLVAWFTMRLMGEEFPGAKQLLQVFRVI